MLLIAETQPEAALVCATLHMTLNTNQLTAHAKGHPSWLFIYLLFGAINGLFLKNKWFLFFSMCHVITVADGHLLSKQRPNLNKMAKNKISVFFLIKKPLKTYWEKVNHV